MLSRYLDNVDGYTGYNGKLSGYLAHARRGFTDALKALPEASAIIYGIVETAKENGLNPLKYLTYLFESLLSIDIEDTYALDLSLPWSESLPDICCLKNT